MPGPRLTSTCSNSLTAVRISDRSSSNRRQRERSSSRTGTSFPIALDVVSCPATISPRAIWTRTSSGSRRPVASVISMTWLIRSPPGTRRVRATGSPRYARSSSCAVRISRSSCRSGRNRVPDQYAKRSQSRSGTPSRAPMTRTGSGSANPRHEVRGLRPGRHRVHQAMPRWRRSAAASPPPASPSASGPATAATARAVRPYRPGPARSADRTASRADPRTASAPAPAPRPPATPPPAPDTPRPAAPPTPPGAPEGA